jgi:hypothetical protein
LYQSFHVFILFLLAQGQKEEVHTNRNTSHGDRRHLANSYSKFTTMEKVEAQRVATGPTETEKKEI